MSFDANIVALAARFGPSVMTAPTGYRAIRLSTADLPNQQLPTPAVLLFPDHGDFEYLPSKRDIVNHIIVRFYYDQSNDLNRQMVALRKWHDVLAYQLQGAAQLGGLVTAAQIMTWRFGTLTYAGQSYSGIEYDVKLVTNEAWAPVS